MRDVEVFQHPWELNVLLTLLYEVRPASVLEVGTWHGGTLAHWLKMADSVVVVDDAMRLASHWQQWADEDRCEITLLQGSSHDADLIAKADELGPYDMVFIDADHTFDAVYADWTNYSPMARRLVVLHDILPRPGYGVSEVWTMLKSQARARWVEICASETLPGNEGPCGIGVVWQA